MIYDTLFAMDRGFTPRPQMVERVAGRRRHVYTFVLRPGLKFHDGTPVTAKDAAHRCAAGRRAT